jgi:hypothetical protein
MEFTIHCFNQANEMVGVPGISWEVILDKLVSIYCIVSYNLIYRPDLCKSDVRLCWCGGFKYACDSI